MGLNDIPYMKWKVIKFHGSKPPTSKAMIHQSPFAMAKSTISIGHFQVRKLRSTEVVIKLTQLNQIDPVPNHQSDIDD